MIFFSLLFSCFPDFHLYFVSGCNWGVWWYSVSISEREAEWALRSYYLCSSKSETPRTREEFRARPGELSLKPNHKKACLGLPCFCFHSLQEGIVWKLSIVGSRTLVSLITPLTHPSISKQASTWNLNLVESPFSFCSAKILSAFLETQDLQVREMAKKELQVLVNEGVLRISETKKPEWCKTSIVKLKHTTRNSWSNKTVFQGFRNGNLGCGKFCPFLSSAFKTAVMMYSNFKRKSNLS